MIMNQPPLFADPSWTDRWVIGDHCRNPLADVLGTVTAISDRTIDVKWHDHPTWGTYTTTYGSDHLLQRGESA